MELLILFILKSLDCSATTIKHLLLIKNKNFLSSLTNAIAAYFYLVMLVNLNKNSSTSAIIVICTATFIGSLLPSLILSKLERDKVFIFDLIPPNKQSGKELADTLRENNIPIQTYRGYNKDKEVILCIKAFSENKTESILIEEIIPKDCKYHIQEVKKYYEN